MQLHLSGLRLWQAAAPPPRHRVRRGQEKKLKTILKIKKQNAYFSKVSESAGSHHLLPTLQHVSAERLVRGPSASANSSRPDNSQPQHTGHVRAPVTADESLQKQALAAQAENHEEESNHSAGVHAGSGAIHSLRSRCHLHVQPVAGLSREQDPPLVRAARHRASFSRFQLNPSEQEQVHSGSLEQRQLF
jgi:hypothetical protein